ncbi:2-amino-4-hydroxy-6-hydroxymethyldihydropteridine diphosphokinase [Chryseobacterium sp.]|uniref:2-amino-4-hydroxy-6- hydroxymethyldihydropteridine diphosphokinase n=1 Tax=Chryseobacterium sp. TaxID=1871047 RepID=UPI0011C72B3E|nr:2-amino-4-hydroxy-6-hydroxymethyldihydropteridine diphosphokinase [Chryseobacterium sp.]TXF77420.1 2-amino-4-hydroxy-6-hydroxymethyldihydropteridine diphosphokinase [Chryseobacterium sp.]
MSHQHVTLLLGSNLGDRKKNIETALNKIENKIGHILKKSVVLETTPVEFASSNNFCNIAVLLITQFSPQKILKIVKEIEVEMGRVADSKAVGGYTDRIIDIDIVLFNGLKFESANLKIPHQKHLFERSFSIKLIKCL